MKQRAKQTLRYKKAVKATQLEKPVEEQSKNKQNVSHAEPEIEVRVHGIKQVAI